MLPPPLRLHNWNPNIFQDLHRFGCVVWCRRSRPRSCICYRKAGVPAPHNTTLFGYFTSTVAPASVNFFLMVSASSLETPSLIFLGAPSTSSLASFKPRLVTSRTALITLILLAPTSLRTTL